MGVLSGVARLLLVVVNILFLLIGLTLAVIGFILRFAKTLYEGVLDDGLGELDKILKDTNLANFNPSDLDLNSIVQGIAIGLIVGGIILVTIALLGCCGACYKINFILWLYAIVIIVFIIGEAVAVGLLYGKPDIIKDGLKKTLEKYEGLASSNITSVGWNVVMIQFDCCGVDNYTDFNEATNWDRHPGLSKGVNVTLETPLACCTSLPTAMDVTAFACATSYNHTTSNGGTGCYDVIWDKSFGKTEIAVPVLVICGIVQVAFIIFTFIIIKSKKGISPI